MGIFKYIHFLYLILAAMFIYDGIVRLSTNEDSPWLSFAFAAAAIFMFFFRRRFSKKMHDRYNK